MANISCVPGGSVVKNLTANMEMQETQAQSLDQEDPLEQEIATCSTILAWKIPWVEELGWLQSIDCKESDMTEHTRPELQSTFTKTLLCQEIKDQKVNSDLVGDVLVCYFSPKSNLPS